MAADRGLAFPARGVRGVVLALGVSVTVAACGQSSLDAGHDKPHGLLPVDERNPVIFYNDGGRDNWSGEYGLLLANYGRWPLQGLIVTTSKYWPDASVNNAAWTAFLTAARGSGLKNIPAITASAPGLLQRPTDNVIESTVPIPSDGAQLIRTLSAQLAEPYRPLVVVCGTRLTDIANAYLLDHDVANRVVVVASLGQYSAPNATMDGPNGELDPWSDWIVAHRFTYVQVSTYYQGSGDVPDSELPSLPPTTLGDWIKSKQPDVSPIAQASDQVAVLAVGLPNFVTGVQRLSPDPAAVFDPTAGPPLRPDAAGRVWVVTKLAAPLARGRLWEMLLLGS